MLLAEKSIDHPTQRAPQHRTRDWLSFFLLLKKEIIILRQLLNDIRTCRHILNSARCSTVVCDTLSGQNSSNREFLESRKLLHPIANQQNMSLVNHQSLFHITYSKTKF